MANIFLLQIVVSDANIADMEKLKAWLEGERGRKMKLALACGISHAAIYQWEKVPAERVPAVSRATGIPREDLRPDLYGELEPTE